MDSAPRSIRWQFLAASLLSAGVLVIILIWDQARVTRKIFYQQATESAKLNSRAIQTLALESLEKKDMGTLRNRLRRLAKSPDIAYIDLLDRMGNPIISFTNKDLLEKGLPPTRSGAREYLFDVEIPLDSGNRHYGALRIGTNVRELKASMDSLILRGLLLGLLLLGLVAGIAWWFGNLLGARLHSLMESIRRLPGGAGVIPAGGNDEVAFLAKTFNDMSRKLEAERQERRKVEKFKEDIIHMLVHDLKNPLTTLSLLSWSLAKENKDAPADKKNLELLERNVLQLEEMVRGILDVAKMQKMQAVLKRKSVHSSTLVDECLQDYRLQAEAKSLRLSAQVQEGLPPLQGDPEILRRVLGNLVSNALQHTPEGRGIRIAAKSDPFGVLFSVADDGEGIPQEDHKRIFEKFVQGRRPSAKGSGLGLSFCRMAIELHGGKIWVESEAGKGSVFYFTLPVTGAALQQTTAASEEKTSATPSPTASTEEPASPETALEPPPKTGAKGRKGSRARADEKEQEELKFS